jgi:hypothetical protein
MRPSDESIASRNAKFGIGRSRNRDGFESLLWPQGAIPVDPTSSKESVAHHALAQQKKGDYQRGHKCDTSNCKPD